MLTKEFCKSLLTKKLDEAKLLIKKAKWRCRDFPYKDSILLPDIKEPKTIILLLDKSAAVVDAFPYTESIKEI